MGVELGSRPFVADDATGNGAPPPAARESALFQTAAFARNPSTYMIRNRERYGDCYQASFIGMPPIVYVSRPDLIKQAFDTDKGGGQAGAPRAEFLEVLVGRNSLLTLDGDEWLRQRRLLSPPFHGAAIERWREQIATIAGAEVERWPIGTPFKLRPRMQAITLEVILRVVFGLGESERHERLRALLPRLLDHGAWAAWIPGRITRALERLSGGPRALRRANPMARLVELRDEVDALLYEEISQRRASANGGERSDVLSILLEARDEDGEPMSDVELRDELVTLLEAGHETTATGLAWAFERLVRYPAVLGRLEEGAADDEQAYLDAVVRECLRVRPVVIDTLRALTEPLEVDGFQLPTGHWIATAIPAVHTHPAVWEEPRAFRPERFIDSQVPPHSWIPFGGGQRRCIGSRLAMLEMQTVITEVVRRLHLRPSDPRPEPARLSHVTMVPARGAEVLAEAKSA